MRAILLLVVLSGCARPLAAYPVVIGDVASEEERRLLSEWIDESRRVLASAEFAQNLASLAGDYPLVFLREGEVGNVSRLARVLRVEEPGLRYAGGPVSLSDDRYAASTGVHSMTVGRGHLQRYASDNMVERSCAINTLTHELTHTISTGANSFAYAVMDTGTAAPSDPSTVLASYLVGAVAQCTWLQARGRLPDDHAHLRACTEIFGVRNFNSLRCNLFAERQPVEARPDLPAPAPPAWTYTPN